MSLNAYRKGKFATERTPVQHKGVIEPLAADALPALPGEQQGGVGERALLPQLSSPNSSMARAMRSAR